MYGVIKAAGTNDWVWFLFATILHAFNALLFYLFAKKVMVIFNHPHAAIVAFSSALVFLVSPYQTETVVWGGAINYMIVSFFILCHLNVLLNYYTGPTRKWLIACIITFLLAAFSHEWGLFLLPADILIFISISITKREIGDLKKHLALIFFLTAVVGLYFGNQLLHGQLIGHYGAETHLHFKFAEIISAFCKYLAKILLLPAFVSNNFQSRVYGFFEKPDNLYLLIGFLLVSAVIALVFYKKRKQLLAPFILGFLLFAIFVFPVLNLYFPYWTKIQGDRYCYLPTAFFVMACFSLLFYRYLLVAIPLCLLYGLFNIYALQRNITNWHSAGQLVASLQATFPDDTSKNYYLLNVPDNFNGAYMFRNLGKSCFAQTMFMQTGMDRNFQITDVQSYNMQGIDDSVVVSVIDSATIRVELSKWGSWWWRVQKNFEDDRIKVQESGDNHSYTLRFKKRDEKDVILYQAGSRWSAVVNN